MTPKLQRILEKKSYGHKTHWGVNFLHTFQWNVCSGSNIPPSLKLSKGLQNTL